MTQGPDHKNNIQKNHDHRNVVHKNDDRRNDGDNGDGFVPVAETRTMRKYRWRLRLGEAGLTGCSAAALLLAGQSLLLPLGAAAIGYYALFHSARGRKKEIQARDRFFENCIVLAADDPLYERTRRMAARLGVAMPAVYLAPPRLYEYGVYVMDAVHRRAPRDARIKLPSCLYDPLIPGRPPVFTPAEQDAVIAHELAHLKHDDARRGSISSMMTVASAAAYVAGGVGFIVGTVPLAALAAVASLVAGALVLKNYCSRQREYRADALAGAVTQDPAALAQALEKIYRIGDHTKDFLLNARDIAEPHNDGGFFVAFKRRPPLDRTGRNIMRLARAAEAVAALCGTHPLPRWRYRALRATGRDCAVILPPRRPAVDMQAYLCRTADGLVLPPFALPETMVRNRAHDLYVVATCLTDFNAVAGPYAQTPRAPFPRRARKGRVEDPAP